MKICSKCKLEKHETEFCVRKDRLCGFRSQCKACDLIYLKTARGKQAHKRYAQSDKGRESACRRYKRYYQTDNGKTLILRRSLEYAKTSIGKEALKRYRRSFKGRLMVGQRDRRRRERKHNLDLKLTKVDVQYIYARFYYRCFKCSNPENLQIDHHYPLSKGFGLSLKNAVLLCKQCNISKRDKLPEEFYTINQLIELREKLSS